MKLDNTYIILFSLLKNSGKIKDIIHEACNSKNLKKNCCVGNKMFFEVFSLQNRL